MEHQLTPQILCTNLFQARRKWMKLTLEDLAEKIGVSPTILGQWERGRRSPTFFNLCAWTQALGLELWIKEKAPTKGP